MAAVKTYNARDNFLQGGQTQLFGRLNLASLQGNFTRDWGGFFIMKKCSKCRENKESENFRKDSSKIDGLDLICKGCRKKYYKENKDRVSAKNKKYYEENRSYLKKKSLDRYHGLPNKLEYSKKYYKENRKKIAAQKANRRAVKPDCKISNNLRRRMRLALQGKTKSNNSIKLLGCTTKELRNYLESQFSDGMSWDNYGFYGWHIDHVIPCASFDLSDPEQQRQCFHYTNLQPLWAKDNLSKSNKTTT